jgi:predicted nucleic acid-binding protein
MARRVLQHPEIGFSAQVAQEFYDAAVRKQRLEITHEEALAILEALRAYPVVSVTFDLVLRGIELKERFRISYWDAAILAAAQELGYETVFSEDLSDGRSYDGVRVENPFHDFSRSAGIKLRNFSPRRGRRQQ